MKKRLLLFAAAALTTMSGFALEVGEMVYTPQGRFRITDATNFCTNGNFESTTDPITGEKLYTGWKSLTNNSFSSFVAVNPAGDNGLSTNSLQCNTFNANYGIYYALSGLSANENYVVSFKVKAAATAVAPDAPVTLQQHYLIEDTISHAYDIVGTAKYQISHAPYVNVVGNTGDGVYATAGFVSVGGASMLTGEWQTVSYAIEGDGTTRTWYFVLKGMPVDMEIADVQVQLAEKGFDDRNSKKILGMAKAIVNAYDWSQKFSKYPTLEEDLDGIKENIINVEDATFDSEKSTVEDLESVVTDFLETYFDDYFNSCKANTYWPTSTLKKQRNITSIGDWTKTLNGARMGYNWNDNGSQNDYLVLGNFGVGSSMSTTRIEMTKTLEPGIYVWALDGRRFAQYTTYVTNYGFDFGAMRLFVGDQKSDSIAIYAKDHSQGTNVVVNITEPTTVNIGWECYNEGYDSYTNGGSFEFYNPLLRVFLTGDYNSDQLKYWSKVKEQVTTGRTELTKAAANLNNADYKWGKAVLQACVDTVSPKIVTYEALDSAKVIDETYVEGCADSAVTSVNSKMIYTVYTSAVRDILAANRKIVAVNDTLAMLGNAIGQAENLIANRVYSASTMKEQLVSAIANAKQVQTSLMSSDYSEENAQTIKEEIAKLSEAQNTYITAVPDDAVSTLVDIDFENDVTGLDDGNDYEKTASVASFVGNKGTMTCSNFMTTTPVNDKGLSNGTYTQCSIIPYEKGIDVNSVKEQAGVLRVGNGDAIVDFETGEMNNDILRVSMDWYFCRLAVNSTTGAYIGFYLSDENSEDVSGMYFTPYYSTASYNPCEFAISSSSTPSNTSGDAALISDGNHTKMILCLDYGTKKAQLSTETSSGLTTSEWVDFNGNLIKSFRLTSNYVNYNNRRCWFDNLKIERISADAPDAVSEVKAADAQAKAAAKKVVNGQLVIETAKGTFNAAGAQVK